MRGPFSLHCYTLSGYLLFPAESYLSVSRCGWLLDGFITLPVQIWSDQRSSNFIVCYPNALFVLFFYSVTCSPPMCETRTSCRMLFHMLKVAGLSAWTKRFCSGLLPFQSFSKTTTLFHSGRLWLCRLAASAIFSGYFHLSLNKQNIWCFWLWSTWGIVLSLHLQAKFTVKEDAAPDKMLVEIFIKIMTTFLGGCSQLWAVTESSNMWKSS